MQRIAELFNVNTFIVSQVNPHTVPFLWDTIGQDKVENFYSKRRMIMRLIQNEFKHIRNQLHTIGYAPAYMDHIYKIASLTSKGHVQIVPDQLSMRDYRNLMSNMTNEAFFEAL
jgi:hypothetical protein